MPEGPEQTPKPDQSEEVSQTVAKGTVNIADKSGKQTLQNTEEVVLLGQGPKKLAREVEYEINVTGNNNRIYSLDVIS